MIKSVKILKPDIYNDRHNKIFSQNYKKDRIFEFKENGINVLIGKNGCGKSTLLNIITDAFLCRGKEEPSTVNITNTSRKINNYNIRADFKMKIFRMLTASESTDNNIALENNVNFRRDMIHRRSSNGESASYDLTEFITRIEKKIPVKGECAMININNTDGGQIIKEYYNSHDIGYNSSIVTYLLDEPDRNLDIYNILDLAKTFNMFSKLKYRQFICVLHNPILIKMLMDNKNINFIEMSKGYKEMIKRYIK